MVILDLEIQLTVTRCARDQCEVALRLRWRAAKRRDLSICRRKHHRKSKQLQSPSTLKYRQLKWIFKIVVKTMNFVEQV
jgi:hypothetical protein